MQSKIKALGQNVVQRMKPSKKREKFLDNVSVVLAKHMKSMDTIKLDLPFNETDGTFFDLIDSIQSLLWNMYNTIRTISSAPKQSWSDYALDLLIGYDDSDEVAKIQEAVETLYKVGRELSSDYYQWWDDAVRLKLIDVDKQRPDLPSFFSDVLQACYDKCRDPDNASLLCEICGNTDAGKLLGGLTLVNKNHGLGETINQEALQYNVILSTIREIIITLGYYGGLSSDLRKKYDRLELENDVNTSIYADCKECKKPYNCVSGSLEGVCKNATVLKQIFSDQKRKEVFYVGYKVLTSRSALLTFADRFSTFFISSQSILDTLIGLANVVIDGTPITWEVISNVYKFLATMKGSMLVNHSKLVSKLNDAIRVYGVACQTKKTEGPLEQKTLLLV